MRVLLIDDHKIVRDGLKQILGTLYPDSVIDEGSNAEDVFSKLKASEFDIIICDLTLPGRSGIDVVKQVKEMYPRLPVLILSMHPEEQYAIRALKAGAAGYLTKTAGTEEIVKAIERILQGRKYISPQISELLAEGLQSGTVVPHEDLSDREFHVFKLLAEGLSVTEIAEQLSLSLSTVSTYRSRILKKMQLKTNADLTRYAITHQLI